MPVLVCMLLTLVCSLVMCLFGFFVGRCARKLPIIDNNLPWTMHRSYTQQIVDDTEAPTRPQPGPECWPWS
jgi:hypothetical protein